MVTDRNDLERLLHGALDIGNHLLQQITDRMLIGCKGLHRCIHLLLQRPQSLNVRRRSTFHHRFLLE